MLHVVSEMSGTKRNISSLMNRINTERSSTATIAGEHLIETRDS